MTAGPLAVWAYPQVRTAASYRKRALTRWQREREREEPSDRWRGVILAMPVRHRECQFPIGEPKTEEFRFCGAPTVSGKSYCRRCCDIVFERRECGALSGI